MKEGVNQKIQIKENVFKLTKYNEVSSISNIKEGE